MIIGIDLSSLQNGHRMRGIGYTLINLINNIPAEYRKKHSFIFFYDTDSSAPEPLHLLNLSGMQYEVRSLQSARRIAARLPGKLNVMVRFLNQFVALSSIHFGDSRITNLNDIEVFLQTDQMVPLPRGRGIRNVFIAYDVIPYVLEQDYLWNYRTARSHGLPLQAALRCTGRRWLYIHKLRANVRRADMVLAISEVTRQDFLHYVRNSPDKIKTVPLGITQPEPNTTTPAMHRYMSTSWGYIKRDYVFSDTPFLLFVGGADKRRKLDEVVFAFNQLRARGNDIKLVLAGDTMQGPLSVPTEPIQKALLESSYIEDIVFMGFVDDIQRNWLYQHALAFVYPSVYEGFGLPVLEAMAYGTSVISFNNAATKEVAGDRPLYVSNSSDIVKATQQYLAYSTEDQQFGKVKNIAQANKYTWAKTVANIFLAIS